MNRLAAADAPVGRAAKCIGMTGCGTHRHGGQQDARVWRAAGCAGARDKRTAPPQRGCFLHLERQRLFQRACEIVLVQAERFGQLGRAGQRVVYRVLAAVAVAAEEEMAACAFGRAEKARVAQ